MTYQLGPPPITHALMERALPVIAEATSRSVVTLLGASSAPQVIALKGTTVQSTWLEEKACMTSYRTWMKWRVWSETLTPHEWYIQTYIQFAALYINIHNIRVHTSRTELARVWGTVKNTHQQHRNTPQIQYTCVVAIILFVIKLLGFVYHSYLSSIFMYYVVVSN